MHEPQKEKKHELTAESKIYSGEKLFRIRALVSFDIVKEGELGGWIEKEQNSGEAWISDDAMVYDDARVYGKAHIHGNAQIDCDTQVCDGAHVFGNAVVSGKAQVYNNAQIYDKAQIGDITQIYGNARIYDRVRICGEAKISDIVIGPMGSRSAYTTFYQRADGETMVVCGCFHHTLNAFDGSAWQ